MQQNPPQDHHFIPIFYLKNWANADGTVCQYSKPHPTSGIVKTKMVHPAGTGYVKRLYALKGLNGPAAQVIEEKLMSPLDSEAAIALQTIKDGGALDLGERSRFAWCQFIMSLLHRHPNDIEKFKIFFARYWNVIMPWERDAYKKASKKNWPARLEDFTQKVPDDQIERLAMQTLIGLMSDEVILDHLRNKMFWGTITLPILCPELLATDRPFMMSQTINSPDSGIMIPIGPKQFFYALHSREYVARIGRTDPQKIVRAINDNVVGRATHFVWARSSVHKSYVHQQIGSIPYVTSAERMERDILESLSSYRRKRDKKYK